MVLVAMSARCASAVAPDDRDATPVTDAAVSESSTDASAPPFVSAPPTTGPFSLCGAIGTGTVAALEFDPARTALAVGAYAGFVRFVDARDGRNVGLIFAHSYGLTSLAFSPDRTLLATAGNDFGSRDVRLWSPLDGARVRSITLSSDPVAVAFVADGSALIVTQRNAVSRFRVRDGSEEWTVRRLEHPIDASAVSPDGATIAFISDQSISLLRASDGATMGSVHDTFMRNRRAIVFSPDSSSVAVGYQYYSANGPQAPALIARVIDVATSATRAEIEGTRSVNALRFSPSGDELAIALQYQGYERWAVRQGAAWLPRATRLAAVAVEQESHAIAFDGDGARIALASSDAIRTIDARSTAGVTQSFDVVSVLQGSLGWGGGGSVELSGDGRELIVGTRDTAYVYDVATQDVLRRIDHARGVGAFSPDQRTIVTGAENGRVRLWRRSDWSSREANTVADLASVTFLDGSTFAAGGRDAVVLHDASDGSERRRWTLSRRGLPTFDLQISTDATRMAVTTYGGLGGGIDVFDVRTNERVFSINGNYRSRSNSAFLRDGSLHVVQSASSMLLTYSPTGALLSSPTTGPQYATIALSPDERWLLASSSNGTTTIVDRATGQLVQDLGRIGPSATSAGNVLRISRDGSLIARTGGQSTLQLWCRR